MIIAQAIPNTSASNTSCLRFLHSSINSFIIFVFIFPFLKIISAFHARVHTIYVSLVQMYICWTRTEAIGFCFFFSILFYGSFCMVPFLVAAFYINYGSGFFVVAILRRQTRILLRFPTIMYWCATKKSGQIFRRFNKKKEKNAYAVARTYSHLCDYVLFCFFSVGLLIFCCV